MSTTDLTDLKDAGVTLAQKLCIYLLDDDKPKPSLDELGADAKAVVAMSNRYDAAEAEPS